MGLLLSVLITCVGVLEVVAFYTNFNFGVTYQQYKSDLTDIARSYAWELRRNHLHHLFPDGDPEEEFSRMLETQRSKLASTRSISRARPYKEDDNISIDEDSTYDQISEIDNELLKNIEIINDNTNEIMFVSGSLEKEIAESMKIEELPKDDEEEQMQISLQQKQKLVTEFIEKEMDDINHKPIEEVISKSEINKVPKQIEEIEFLDQKNQQELPKPIEEVILPSLINKKADQISEEPYVNCPKQNEVKHESNNHIEDEIILTSKQDLETNICSPIVNNEMKSFLDQLESQIITDEAEFDQKKIDNVEAPYIKSKAATSLHGTVDNPGEIIEELCVQKHFMDLTDESNKEEILPTPINISEIDLSTDVKKDIKELAQESSQILTDFEKDEKFDSPVIEETLTKKVTLTSKNEEVPKEVIPQQIVEEIVQKSNVSVEGSPVSMSDIDHECAELTKDPSKLGTDEIQPVERVPSPYPMSLFGLSTGNGITDLVVNEDFLRSLDGVKPTRSEDRRRSFKKKRNSSSSSKDRASRDRSNDSTEARTELDLKEIEALDALSEKNGSFEENCLEENLHESNQNHEKCSEENNYNSKHKNVDLKTQPAKNLETKEKIPILLPNDNQTISINQETLLQNEPTKIIPDQIIPKEEQTSPNKQVEIETRIEMPKQTEISYAEPNKNKAPAIESILQNEHTKKDSSTTFPEPERDQSVHQQEKVDLESQKDNSCPQGKNEPSSILEESKTKAPSEIDQQKSPEILEKSQFTSEAARLTPEEEIYPPKEVSNFETNKPNDESQKQNIPQENEPGSSKVEESKAVDIIEKAPSETDQKSIGLGKSECVPEISKSISEKKTASPEEMSSFSSKTIGESSIPPQEPINLGDNLESKLAQNEATGKIFSTLRDETGSSPIESKILDQEPKTELPDEEKKAQSVHKMDETVPNSSPKTLAQEANAIVAENRRKFFKTASINSFEDASSSQNEQMNQRELNKVNTVNDDNQKMATTISLPNSDAFWVKE